jgi:hypothetical protein
VLSEPIGTPIKLSHGEAQAIIREHLASPPKYDKGANDARLRELRKIRRESGALLIRDIDG